MVIPVPAPVGVVNLRGYYLLLIVFTFVFMAKGYKSIDGMDGFAGGTSALAFVAM